MKQYYVIYNNLIICSRLEFENTSFLHTGFTSFNISPSRIFSIESQKQRSIKGNVRLIRAEDSGFWFCQRAECRKQGRQRAKALRKLPGNWQGAGNWSELSKHYKSICEQGNVNHCFEHFRSAPERERDRDRDSWVAVGLAEALTNSDTDLVKRNTLSTCVC